MTLFTDGWEPGAEMGSLVVTTTIVVKLAVDVMGMMCRCLNSEQESRNPRLSYDILESGRDWSMP